jgi:hypothetical protein
MILRMCPFILNVIDLEFQVRRDPAWQPDACECLSLEEGFGNSIHCWLIRTQVVADVLEAMNSQRLISDQDLGAVPT